MKKLLFTMLFISAFFWSCSPELITITKNDADNSTAYRLQTGYILGRTGSMLLQPCGTINPEKIIRNDSTFYNLVVDAWTHQYLEIEEGRSLLFALNGKALSFETDPNRGNTKDVLNNRWGTCSEKAWYSVTAEDLKKIASTKNVLFRIKGQIRELQGEFDPQGFLDFQEFVKLHVN